MPLKLANPNTSPPGGHSFFVQPTKTNFGGSGQYPTRHSLLSAMRPHCKSHNIPIPTEPEIDEFMCAKMPPGICVDAQSGLEVWTPAPFNGGGITFAQVIQGTRTLGYWATHGRPRVDGALAEQRAGICVGCRANQTVSGCTGCNLRTLTDAIASVVQGQSTTVDESLGACSICGCHLRAKVWLPLDILLKYQSAAQIDFTRREAPHCWQIKEQSK